MSGVKLINETDHDIILQEGSGGIFTPRAVIATGKNHVLKVDTNDTYREYLCRLSYKISEKGQAVTFTSDDFAEYEQVKIKWDKDSKTLSYETKKRESSGSSAAAAKRSGQASLNFFQQVFSRFNRKKEHAPTDGGGGGSGDADAPRHGGAVE